MIMSMRAAPDVDHEGLSVQIANGTDGTVTVRVFQRGLQEEFTELTVDPDDERYLPAVLASESRFVRFTPLSSRTDARLPVATAAPVAFSGGSSPTVPQYVEAIGRLADDLRIDIVLASIELAGQTPTSARSTERWARMLRRWPMWRRRASPSGRSPQPRRPELDQIREHSALVRNRRFVLVAPPRAEGAVAGLVGRLEPRDLPTFKPTPLFGIPPARYRDSELNRLLGSTTNLCVVQDRMGRGVIVLRGLDTSGDQISVTRVADICIRETRNISENSHRRAQRCRCPACAARAVGRHLYPDGARGFAGAVDRRHIAGVHRRCLFHPASTSLRASCGSTSPCGRCGASTTSTRRSASATDRHGERTWRRSSLRMKAR